MPVIMLLGVLCLHYGTSLLKKFQQNTGGKSVTDHSHQMVGLALTSMYMVYLYISETSLDVFNCGQIVSEDGVKEKGKGEDGTVPGRPEEKEELVVYLRASIRAPD